MIHRSSTSAFTVESLASGSSGNAILIRSEGTHVLIDAGLSLKTLTTQLTKRGIGPGQLHGILLTHEHTDHASGAPMLARRYQTPLIANRPTLQAVSLRDSLGFDTVECDIGRSLPIGNIVVRSFPVPHDAISPVGYTVEHGGTRVAHFTDAGCVTPAMREALRGAKLAIVEANHDVDWLLRGPYTAEMKARVVSETGHLSNADCADLIVDLLEDSGPCSFWLAHLSRVNNSVALARRFVTQRIRQGTCVPFALDIALRDAPSVSWQLGRDAVQLAML